MNIFTKVGCITSAAMLMLGVSIKADVIEKPDTLMIPTRAVIVSGNGEAPGTPEMIGVFYNTEDSYFNDPSAPRYLLLDREGRVALGIGGQIYGTLQYDFNGSIDDGSDFATYFIPVPDNPAQRQAFRGDAAHSSLFLKMVGKTSRFGYFSAYLQTSFTGGTPGSYNLKLKQAYLSLGYMTVGLTNSVFADPASTPPTIDTEGPTGQVSAKNVLFKYNPCWKNNFCGGFSVEMPKVGMTSLDNVNMAISPRVPDIPAFVQYFWSHKEGHLRLSGILRTMSYRDLIRGKNRFCTGWGIQFSGMTTIQHTGWKFYWQAVYGHGIGRYLNDLSNGDFDLIYTDDNNGRMEAPGMLGLIGGIQYSFSNKLIWSTSYSYSRLYDAGHLGGDTYKRANYFVTNMFYNIIPDLKLGIEYLWGQRMNYNHESGHANRVMALIQFEF